MAATVSRRYSVANPPRVTVSRPEETVPETVVALRGELDSAALMSLVDTFDEAIAQDDSDIVVDLAGVDFIGAAWIGTFVRSRAVLQTQDRELTLRSPSRVVFRLLDLCGLSYLTEPIGVTEPELADQALSASRRSR
jgi:anti-anti-sigma factor